MARNTSLVAVTDESAESDRPIAMATVMDFAALVEAAKATGSVASDGSLGSSADIVQSEDLVGVPFVIVAIHVNEGDNGYFASPEVKLADGRIVLFNDGSAGVARQLIDRDEGDVLPAIKLPMWVPKGLRKSEYDLADCPACKRKQPRKSKRNPYKCQACGKDIPPTVVNGSATTYYLSTQSE